MPEDKELNLSGDVCPITFVKSKLKLEEMSQGEILKITLDYRPSVLNVPRSLEQDGHQVLQINEIQNGIWEVFVKKG